MKNLKLKTELAVLACGLCLAAGGISISAYSETANAINASEEAFSSLELVNGASVRYDTDGKGNGFSYMLTMNKNEYDALFDGDYSEVKFGLLIGPESYYQTHPFDDQEAIDTYYSLNEDEENKAFLYDCSTTKLIVSENEADKVYFRGSIVNIKNENLIMDYRAVGYVSYTVDGRQEKRFLTKQNSADIVRCPVEIAENAIADLGSDSQNADKVNMLKTTYVDKAVSLVQWGTDTSVGNAANWTSGNFGNYEFQDSGVADIPKLNYDKIGNRWVDGKYKTEYYLEKGDEKIPFVSGKTETTRLKGVYALKGITSCEVNGKTYESYRKDITFMAIDYTFKTINGADINNTVKNSGTAKSPENVWGNNMAWSESLQRYTVADPSSWYWLHSYSNIAKDQFMFDVILQISGSAVNEFRMYTAKDTFLAIRAYDGGSKLGKGFKVITNKDWKSEDSRGNAGSYVWVQEKSGSEESANFIKDDELMLRVVYKDSMFYVYGAANSDYVLLATISASGVKAVAANMEVTRHDEYASAVNSNVGNYVKAVLTAATQNEFAFSVSGVTGGNGSRYMMDLISTDATEIDEFLNK